MKKTARLLAALVLALLLSAAAASAQAIQPVGEKIGQDAQGVALHKVRANGIDIGYKLLGAGEPLLLIMGLGGVMEQWPQEMLELLSKSHQLLLFDNRGMGASPATDAPFTYDLLVGDILGLLDALGVQQTHVLGYSMGSALTQKLLLEHPQRVKKAIIYATTTDGSQVAAHFAKTPPGRIPPSVARQIEATIPWKTPLDKLPGIANQVLLVVGTADQTVGIESSKTLAAAIPGAWLAQFKNATHALMRETPVAFAKTVLNFLEVNQTVESK